MEKDEGYREAEKRIEEARRTGATRLNLAGLGLTVLPKALGQLTQLQVLFLARNQLPTLPEALGQLTQLKNLDLAHNLLRTLPEALGQLTQLQTLDLSANRLTALPEALGQVTQLQSLHLRGNQLTALPEVIGQLKRLRTLHLTDNRLTVLPEALGQLTHLQWLHLGGNRLTALPAGLRQLSWLEQLDLHDNPGLGIPPEILGPYVHSVAPGKASPGAPQAILDYYFRIHPPTPALIPSRPLNEAKVIIVGQGGVGKTSLVNRIVYDTFNPGEGKTDGININKEWSVPGRNGAGSVQINFWDFGGQEIMHATHQFFLTRRTVYLLVLDARKGENECNVQYWLKVIHSFGGGSPVLVVTNHCEEHYRELNETRLRTDYPYIRGFFKTSCKADTGIAELKAAIGEQVCGEEMRHVFDLLPGEYFTVKEELEALAEERERIDIHEYYALCERHELAGRAEQDRLLRFLHDLGSVLNFNDPNDPYELKETNVLNPEWVTAGVYRVLNDVEVAKRGGELTRNDLRRILDPETHPEDSHDFIVEMMRKFELCFVVEDKRRWLVPELLHVNEPDLGWDYAQSLNFEYHYEVLPPGIICRFITRRYKNLSRKPTYWRSGVVLELEGCRALVRSDTDKGRMFVSVLGPKKRLRGALAVIRDEFRLLHGTVPKLEPKEMVPLPDQRAVTVEYGHLLKLEAAVRDTIWPEGAEREYSVAELLEGIADRQQRDKDRTLGEVDGRRRPAAEEPPERHSSPAWFWPAVAAAAGLGAAGWLWLILAIPSSTAKALLSVAGVVFIAVLFRNPKYWYRRMAAMCIISAGGVLSWSAIPQFTLKAYEGKNPIVDFVLNNSVPAWPAGFFLAAGCFFGWLAFKRD